MQQSIHSSQLRMQPQGCNAGACMQPVRASTSSCGARFQLMRQRLSNARLRASSGSAAGDGASDIDPSAPPPIRLQAQAPVAPPEVAGSSTSSRSWSDHYKSTHTSMHSTQQYGSSNSGKAINGSRRGSGSQAGTKKPKTPVTPAAGIDAAFAASSEPAAAKLEEAMRKAQAALVQAEAELKQMQDEAEADKPRFSIELPPRVQSLLLMARTAALVGAASVALVASHAFGLVWQWAAAALAASAMAGGCW